MEPSHVNVTTGLWVQPRTKNQKPHVTYLPTQARAALAWLPAGLPYVFEGHRADGMYTVDSAEKAWQKIRTRVHLQDVHLHDFRRTFATHLYEATENDRLVKRCLNHTTKDVTAIYVRISNKAVAQAIQAQADRFFALVPHHRAVVPPPVPPVESPVPDPDIRRPLRPTSSGREQHVLQLLAQGHTPTTIAQSLGLSVKTVNTYQGRLKGKLHLATINQLRRFAIQSKTDLPAPVPIGYRAQSVEREEWPG